MKRYMNSARLGVTVEPAAVRTSVPAAISVERPAMLFDLPGWYAHLAGDVPGTAASNAGTGMVAVVNDLTRRARPDAAELEAA